MRERVFVDFVCGAVVGRRRKVAILESQRHAAVTASSTAQTQTATAATNATAVTMPQPLRSACSACRERGSYRTEQKPLIGAGGGSDEDVESSHGQLTGTWADVYALPPLQTPDYCAMRGEACCGNTLVLFLIFLFVAPMQAFVSQMTTPMTFAQTVWMGAIYSEAVTAILCLFGLMWGDPGTVKRSPETSFPMPEIVAERLRNGRSLEGVGNVNEDGRVYCIRCLVWRPDDTETHHCATCQRCVTDFDHHCGVFGRCIAGDGCGGNMGYFKTLILMGCLGCATCVSFMFVAGAGKQRASQQRCSLFFLLRSAMPMPFAIPRSVLPPGVAHHPRTTYRPRPPG